MPVRIYKMKQNEIPWMKPDNCQKNTDLVFRVTVEPLKDNIKKVDAFKELENFTPIKSTRPVVDIIREIRKFE